MSARYLTKTEPCVTLSEDRSKADLQLAWENFVEKNLWEKKSVLALMLADEDTKDIFEKTFKKAEFMAHINGVTSLSLCNHFYPVEKDFIRKAVRSVRKEELELCDGDNGRCHGSDGMFEG